MLEFFSHKHPTRTLWALLLVLITWAVGLYVHPPLWQESPLHAGLISLAVSGINPYLLKSLELLLLMGTVFAVRALMNRLFNSLFQSGLYILLACLSATSLSLSRAPMLAPGLGLILLVYGTYLLTIPSVSSILSSRVLRASVSLSVASLLFLPYGLLLPIPLLATVQRGAMNPRIFAAWLAGALLPHAFALATCYLFGISLLAYIPDYSPADITLEVILSTLNINPLQLAYWFSLITLWVVAELLYPPQLSSQRNSYLLARNLRIFTIIALLISLILTGATTGLSLALGPTMSIPITRLLLSSQRAWLKTLLFTTLLAMALITQLVG
ncbi:MAG: hypothetical protein CSA07_01120 [Bacteroidia bacterium]|nr:MAG: hypothetical protein CSA07_01120 [Bacteroidia bacterium]